MLTEDARLADFTNEGGVDGTIRFLKNVMGLWVLSESVRAWGDPNLPDLLESAGRPRLGCGPWSTSTTRALLPPGDMPTSDWRSWPREAGEPVPDTPAEFTRCVLDSLALAYRRHVRQAAALAGPRGRRSCTSSAAARATTCCAS